LPAWQTFGRCALYYQDRASTPQERNGKMRKSLIIAGISVFCGLVGSHADELNHTIKKVALAITKFEDQGKSETEAKQMVSDLFTNQGVEKEKMQLIFQIADTMKRECRDNNPAFKVSFPDEDCSGLH
jgi:hypothetical protein